MILIDLKVLLKAAVIAIVIVALSVLFSQLLWRSKIQWEDEDEDIISTNQGLKMNDTVVSKYDEQFAKCLRSHVKSSYYPVTQGKTVSASCESPGRCLHDFLIETSKIFKSLDLTLLLLEPSLLFCLLPSSRKYNLLTRGFIPSEYKGLKNVVTFGVESAKAEILDKAKTRKKLTSLRYKILRLGGKEMEDSSVEIIPHYFLIQYDMVAHISVLYQQESFLLLHSFNSSEMDVKGIQYVDDRAFEDFATSVSYLDTSNTAPVLLPSDSRYFLLDTMSSKFVKCKGEAVDIISKKSLKALKELKSILSSHMVIFWLWSTSLHGWYENCDIYHYSKELKFSISAKSVEGFNFSALFTDSKCQYTESYSDAMHNISSVKLNCYDVDFHLIFMYEDKITYWGEHLDADNMKFRFPKFTLCSTDIYGMKFNVPCEMDEILESHYGQFLTSLTSTTLKLRSDTMLCFVLFMCIFFCKYFQSL